MSFDTEVANKMAIELRDELSTLKINMEAELGEFDEEDDDVKQSTAYLDLEDKIQAIDNHIDSLDYLISDLRDIGRMEGRG